MLDASFIQPATRFLHAAGDLRRLYQNRRPVIEAYRCSPADKTRELDRIKREIRLRILLARQQNARAALHSAGDTLLRRAEAEILAGHPLLAIALRREAHRLFDRVDRVPPPDLD